MALTRIELEMAAGVCRRRSRMRRLSPGMRGCIRFACFFTVAAGAIGRSSIVSRYSSDGGVRA